MKNLLLLLFVPFLITGQETKNSEIINPAGKWFFGAEIGPNVITSYSLGEPNKSFQGGILAEFYTGRHWSLTGRIKYFKTGMSYYKPEYKSATKSSGMGPNLTGLFDSDASFGKFDGVVLTIPINIKWEFRIWKNFSGNLNFGINYNFETKNDYLYSDINNYEKYNSKQYSSINSGFGFNYFISKKLGVFLNTEGYSGGIKGKTGGILSSQIFNSNTLLNFGVKYNFNN